MFIFSYFLSSNNYSISVTGYRCIETNLEVAYI